MDGNALPADPAVRHRCLQFNGRNVSVRYPATAPMDGVFDEVFGKQDYPYLPFLEADHGAVVDVGANVGCATLWFALLYPNRPVYAFEPGRDAFAFLQENTQAFSNVRAFQYGWYDRDAEVDLYLGAASVHHSMGKSPLASANRETIKVRRASTVVAELNIERISVLKVDTEGAEVAIFRDLERFLDRIDAVFFEYHSEGDRLEIDHLLSRRFMMYSGRVLHAHRGSFGYVAKDLIARRTELHTCAIERPRL